MKSWTLEAEVPFLRGESAVEWEISVTDDRMTPILRGIGPELLGTCCKLELHTV